MIICPECGNEMGPLANFCNMCGAELPASTEEVKLEEVIEFAEFCCEAGHNGMRQILNINFCPICGKPLE